MCIRDSPQGAETVSVGRADIDHGNIDREDLFMKQSRDFTQEDRNIITHPVIDGLADVLGDEY